jgi:hypothetical protein
LEHRIAVASQIGIGNIDANLKNYKRHYLHAQNFTLAAVGAKAC